MASWMIELQARGHLPAGAKVAAAAVLAGGSHMCYQEPPSALSQCKSCSSGSAGFRRLGGSDSEGNATSNDNSSSSSTTRRQLQWGKPRGGCSTTLAASGNTPSCDFCCPTGVTELYYLENPGDYKTHPPCFLAQTEPTGSDFNADLCASKNYYDTLQTHGVKSEIVYLAASRTNTYVRVEYVWTSTCTVGQQHLRAC
jgi:hypothetical protein